MPSVDALIREISGSGNQRLRSIIAESHASEMADAYVAQRASTITGRHAEAAYLLRNDLTATSLNNLGYFYFVNGDLRRAKELFTNSLKNHDKSVSRTLPGFSLAMVHLKLGDVNAALVQLGIVGSGSPEDEEVYCLHVPKLGESGLELEEIRGTINLADEIQKAHTLLSQVSRA